MSAPTDEQIFNYNLPTEPACGSCQSDELKFIEYSDYTTYECKACGFKPEPEEEQ